MLDIQDPSVIADLIEESERILRPHFDKMDELEAWLRSPGYGDNDGLEVPEEWPENVPYSFVGLLMPRMTHAAPRFAFSGGGSRAMREQTLGLQGAQNILARQTRMHLALAPAAMDYLLGFTCLYVDCESQPAHKLSPERRRQLRGKARFVPDAKGPAPQAARTGRDYKKPAGQPRYYDAAMPSWPMADHLARHTYGWDATQKTWARVRYFWHDVVEDLEDLIARAELEPEHWDMEAIQELGNIRQSDNPFNAAVVGAAEQRVKQIKYRMVWVPEGRITEDEFDPDSGEPRAVTQQPSAHEHGVWLTLGVADGSTSAYSRATKFGETAKPGDIGRTRARYLAKPFYRTGSRNPPYKIFGAHIPASKTVPFSPLTANHEQIRLWNDLAAAQQRRMKRYSRQVLFDLKDETTIEAILDAADDDFVGIPGFESGKAQVIERGGLSQQDAAHSLTVQQTLYRGLGMSETLQGNATNNTATAESAAVQTGMSRIGVVVDGWEQGLASVAQEQAWHMAYGDDFWVVLDEQAKIESFMADMQPFIEAGTIDAQGAEQLARIAAQQEVAVWQGGDFASDESLDFGLVRVEIEPMSMERRDLTEQKNDVLQLVPMLAQIGMLVVQQPHIEWKEVLRMLGKVYRQPDLEKMLRLDIAQQLSQIQIAQGLADVSLGNALTPGTQRRGGPGGGGAMGPFGGNRSAGPSASASARPAGQGAMQPSKPSTLSV